MKPFQLFSRRNEPRRVDFRPDPDPESPSAQLRRFRSLLENDVLPANDIKGCDEALAAYREFTYRKIFTGTTHEQFLELDRTNPEAIDWLIAVASADSDVYRTKKSN